jgi:hypothetical protein
MPKDSDAKDVEPKTARRLPPEAQRALAEAEERRKRSQEAEAAKRPKEIGGRSGPEPTRYGDWEKKGIVSDF